MSDIQKELYSLYHRNELKWTEPVRRHVPGGESIVAAARMLEGDFLRSCLFAKLDLIAAGLHTRQPLP